MGIAGYISNNVAAFAFGCIRNDATSIALAEARLKAERMCRTLGAHLGPPLQLVEEPIAELIGFPQPRPVSPTTASNQKGTSSLPLSTARLLYNTI